MFRSMEGRARIQFALQRPSGIFGTLRSILCPCNCLKTKKEKSRLFMDEYQLYADEAVETDLLIW